MEGFVSSVSVIVPTYNRASWLPETVASILQQTYQPLEVLIIDDGSSDNTETVCASFPPPVRYIRQENAGVSAARNRGIREAKGELIAFVDSDDPWESKKLEVQIDVLANLPKVEWSITGCTVVDLKGKKISGPQSWSRVFTVFRGGSVNPDRYFSEWLDKTVINAVGEQHSVYWGDAFGMLFLGNVILPSSVIMQKALAVRTGGFDEKFRLAEETEYFHRVAAVAPLAIVMTPLTRYRVGQVVSLVSSTNMVRLVENALVSIDRAAQFRKPMSLREKNAYEKGKRDLITRLSYIKITNLDKTGARSAIKMVLNKRQAVNLKSITIYLMSYFPLKGLRALQVIKQRLSVSLHQEVLRNWIRMNLIKIRILFK